MTFEEFSVFMSLPGHSEAFSYGLSFGLLAIFIAVFSTLFYDLIKALICRYIWPGKKKDVTQSQDPGAGAAD